MPKFTRNSSVALSWTQDGACHAVRLRRTGGDACRIAATWSGKADKDHPLAEVLAEAARALNAKDAACLIAAPAIPGWGAADVAMPPLPPEQLHNAIAFELRKHTPLPSDKLVWGYRALAKPKSGEKLRLRLVFVRQDLWRQWCNAAAQLAPLDAILPAPVTLDPLCERQTVTFPRHDADAEAWTPAPDGRTFRNAPVTDADGHPLPLQELLHTDFIDVAELAQLPPEQQHPFADAIIAAAYGLTEQPAKDAATLIPLPDSLRAHRSVALVAIAIAIAAVTIAALVLHAVLLLQANLSQQRDLLAEIARLDKLIAEQKAIVRPERLAKIKELEEEIKGDIPDYPPFALALKDITNIFDPERPNKPWISSKLQWAHDSGTIRFSIEEPLDDSGEKPFIEDLNLIDELADSPYLTDVRGNSSSVNQNERKTVRDFTLTLGWQSAEKRAAAAERNLQRQKERAEAKRRRLKEQREQQKLQQEQQEQQQNADGHSDDDAPQTPADDAPAASSPAAPPPLPPLPQQLPANLQ